MLGFPMLTSDDKRRYLEILSFANMFLKGPIHGVQKSYHTYHTYEKQCLHIRLAIFPGLSNFFGKKILSFVIRRQYKKACTYLSPMVTTKIKMNM